MKSSATFAAAAVMFGLTFGVLPSENLRAENDWIRAGTYVDWPETFREDTLLVLPEPTYVATSYDVDEYGQVISADAAEFDVSYEDSVAFRQEVRETVVPTAAMRAPISVSEWQLMPDGLLYHSYLAGEKEPRFASQWLWDKDRGQIWEAVVGGRYGLIRKGTPGPDGQGFQFDIEGAAFVRIDPEEESDMEAADFRAGFIGTWRTGPWRTKFGYYHISSHLGDEYLIKNPTFQRLNYVRDSLLFGMMYDIQPGLQVYGEIAAALNANGGAEPIELQFGIQYFPACGTGIKGAPFAAINGHLRQEFSFGGSVNAEAGWAWRGVYNDNLFRLGFQHYNGPSMQWSFLDRQDESLTGFGLWYDF